MNASTFLESCDSLLFYLNIETEARLYC